MLTGLPARLLLALSAWVTASSFSAQLTCRTRYYTYLCGTVYAHLTTDVTGMTITLTRARIHRLFCGLARCSTFMPVTYCWFAILPYLPRCRFQPIGQHLRDKLTPPLTLPCTAYLSVTLPTCATANLRLVRHTVPAQFSCLHTRGTRHIPGTGSCVHYPRCGHRLLTTTL